MKIPSMIFLSRNNRNIYSTWYKLIYSDRFNI
jgi:hypothetical protein